MVPLPRATPPSSFPGAGAQPRSHGRAACRTPGAGTRRAEGGRSKGRGVERPPGSGTTTPRGHRARAGRPSEPGPAARTSPHPPPAGPPPRAGARPRATPWRGSERAARLAASSWAPAWTS
ncbi:hypothetical protein QJS66_20630 [Kocuria rhizophila]|nr:hypothetical protein QJS66_20630 [Kocuria rhizophila]